MELRIKDVIKEQGSTITGLAEWMGINRINISNMVNGNPTVETLNKIADALDIPLTELHEQPELNTAQLTCPNWGKIINIKVEYNGYFY